MIFHLTGFVDFHPHISYATYPITKWVHKQQHQVKDELVLLLWEEMIQNMVHATIAMKRIDLPTTVCTLPGFWVCSDFITFHGSLHFAVLNPIAESTENPTATHSLTERFCYRIFVRNRVPSYTGNRVSKVSVWCDCGYLLVPSYTLSEECR